MNRTIIIIFKIARNIFAVIGLVFTILLAYVLCSGKYDLGRGENKNQVSHIESLKLSGPYGRDKVKFNIHPVIDSERAAPGQPADLLLADFDYFFQAFEQTHPDPYSAFGGERKFHKKVKSLRRELSRAEGMDAVRLQAEIGRFLVPLHDGHTYCGQMNYSYDSEGRTLPLNLRTMTDGFFVWSAPEDFKGLLGAKVLSIGGLPLDKFMDRLAEYVSSENVYGFRPDWTPTWEDYRRLGFDSRADLLYILEKIRTCS